MLCLSIQSLLSNSQVSAELTGDAIAQFLKNRGPKITTKRGVRKIQNKRRFVENKVDAWVILAEPPQIPFKTGLRARKFMLILTPRINFYQRKQTNNIRLPALD